MQLLNVLQYPVGDRGFDFVSSLVWMFYAPGWAGDEGQLSLVCPLCVPCVDEGDWVWDT